MAKWLSEEALQIAEKRSEVKGKGEKERYTHLSVEFQRRAKRDKKAFLNTKRSIQRNRGKQWNRKIGDSLKKIRDTKGNFEQR